MLLLKADPVDPNKEIATRGQVREPESAQGMTDEPRVRRPPAGRRKEEEEGNLGRVAGARS